MKESVTSYSKTKQSLSPIRYIDILIYAKVSYLVMFDAYYNWLELLKIKNKSRGAINNLCRTIFLRFGSPD